MQRAAATASAAADAADANEFERSEEAGQQLADRLGMSVAIRFPKETRVVNAWHVCQEGLPDRHAPGPLGEPASILLPCAPWSRGKLLGAHPQRCSHLGNSQPLQS